MILKESSRLPGMKISKSLKLDMIVNVKHEDGETRTKSIYTYDMDKHQTLGDITVQLRKFKTDTSMKRRLIRLSQYLMDRENEPGTENYKIHNLISNMYPDAFIESEDNIED